MLRSLLYVGCLCLLAGACAKVSSPEPEEVITAYINKLHRSDFAGAAAYCTPAGVAYVEALKAIMEDPDALPDTSSVVINSNRHLYDFCTFSDQLELCLSDVVAKFLLFILHIKFWTS